MTADAALPARTDGPTRGIDHIVQVVSDLEEAAARYRALGFTTTPPARHPFGTGNILVQFANRSFLELLTVVDPAAIEEPGPGRFSFAAFNRDALAAHGEGGAMVVVRSRDASADRAAFASAGLPVFEPFGFERTATGPDGIARKVAFSLTFTADPAAPDVGIFACQSHYPENFWKPDFQRHDNGAHGIAGIVISTPRPDASAAVWAAVTGAVPRPVAGGLSFDTADGDVTLLTPESIRERWGISIPADRSVRPHIIAMRIAMPEFHHTSAGIWFEKIEHGNAGAVRIVPPGRAHGLMLIIETMGSRVL